MFKRFFCILTTIVMVFCLSCGNIAGVVAVADDEYLTIPTSGGVIESGTYKLTSDLTISSRLQINSNKEVTIDLNGWTLSCKGESVILINGGTLNLTDSSEAGTGSVLNPLTNSNYYGIRLTDGGTLNMSGGTVSGSYGIYSNASTDNTINITGGAVRATHGAAVYNYKGSITISGTDKVVISALSESNTSSYGIQSGTASITISNPNTYVSSKFASAVKKNLSSNTNITAGHYSSDVKNYINTDGYSCKSSDDADYPYVVTADVSPEFYGRSLTMDGEVGVTYYFSMDGVTNPADYVLKTSLGEVTASDEKKIIDGVEYYRYIVYVSPTQFDTTVTATLTDGATKVSVSDYSVYDYCTAAITSDESDELYVVRGLCEAVLNYGYYVEKWLDGSSTIDISSIDLSWDDPVDDEWDVDLSTYSSTANGITGKTLALDGEGIFIRLYVDDDSTYTVSGKEIITGSDNSGSYIEFKVPAKEMNNIFSIYRDGVFYTSYSVYSYIKNMIETSSDADLINVCKAIYYYGQASAAYQGWR